MTMYIVAAVLLICVLAFVALLPKPSKAPRAASPKHVRGEGPDLFIPTGAKSSREGFPRGTNLPIR